MQPPFAAACNRLGPGSPDGLNGPGAPALPVRTTLPPQDAAGTGQRPSSTAHTLPVADILRAAGRALLDFTVAGDPEPQRRAFCSCSCSGFAGPGRARARRMRHRMSGSLRKGRRKIRGSRKARTERCRTVWPGQRHRAGAGAEEKELPDIRRIWTAPLLSNSNKFTPLTSADRGVHGDQFGCRGL